MTLVITACTSRKRKTVSGALRMANLRAADLPELASEWSRRLTAAPERFPGAEIYGGRGFREAVHAAKLLHARLLVVSAGLGLIDAKAEVPPYASTVLVNSSDSVCARVQGDFSVSSWWKALSKGSPFAISLHEATQEKNGLICAALSEAYIEMIAGDLLSLGQTPSTISSHVLFVHGFT
ncbi:hypothetical protein [Sphingorhabdus sp.]|uniref:hypothetical protein n=1 Tax=Sphingorhabdus sp. TaxID=1902408 RepID=UPI00391A22C5